MDVPSGSASLTAYAYIKSYIIAHLAPIVRFLDNILSAFIYIYILVIFNMRDSEIVGESLAQVLPQTGKYWFQQSHLLRLNLLLLVPLLSSSVSGYDGVFLMYPQPENPYSLTFSKDR